MVGRDARDVDALAALAAACVDAGRTDDARVAAERALAFDAEHPLALAVRGDCAAARGEVVEAGRRWQQSLAASPVGAGAVRARRGLRAAPGAVRGSSHPLVAASA